jgi:hypothetical protein
MDKIKVHMHDRKRHNKDGEIDEEAAQEKKRRKEGSSTAN